MGIYNKQVDEALLGAASSAWIFTLWRKDTTRRDMSTALCQLSINTLQTYSISRAHLVCTYCEYSGEGGGSIGYNIWKTFANSNVWLPGILCECSKQQTQSYQWAVNVSGELIGRCGEVLRSDYIRVEVLCSVYRGNFRPLLIQDMGINKRIP